MKNKYIVFWVFSVGVLLSCNTKHKHIHDHENYSEAAHTHEHEKDHQHQGYFASYDLTDKNFGTNTQVTLTNDVRIMVTNALPNHKTGTFPNKGNPNTIRAQNRTYKFPITPKYTGNPKWMREPGVALNGIKFEPGTAEVVECESGENYRVEALQDVIDLGLDFNHAHVQPTGAYHYHGSPTSIINDFDTGEDLVHIGFAHDGFPMYYSKSGMYKSSYKLLDGTREGEDCSYENPMTKMDISVGGHHDGMYGSDFEFVEGHGDLDECNGIIVDDNYMYIVTNEFPYVSRCLMGEVSAEGRKGPPGRGPKDGRQVHHRERLNFDQLLEIMDGDKNGKISEIEAKGPLKNNFDDVDSNKDGYISKDELEKKKEVR